MFDENLLNKDNFNTINEVQRSSLKHYTKTGCKASESIVEKW
jgi:hypothetical protein